MTARLCSCRPDRGAHGAGQAPDFSAPVQSREESGGPHGQVRTIKQRRAPQFEPMSVTYQSPPSLIFTAGSEVGAGMQVLITPLTHGVGEAH